MSLDFDSIVETSALVNGTTLACSDLTGWRSGRTRSRSAAGANGSRADEMPAPALQAGETPSVSFNPALTTAGPGTPPNSGKGPVQKDLTPAPLADREGYAVAESFAEGNPLDLPADVSLTFRTSL